MIYLDNNATTCLDPDVARLLYRQSLEGPQNPSSQHQLGRSARRSLDHAITRVGTELGTDIQTIGGSRCILTSGGTEANNLAILGLLPANLPRFLSKIEHPSILRLGEHLQTTGTQVYWLPVDRHGVLDLQLCEEVFAQHSLSLEDNGPDQISLRGSLKPTGLVSVMFANNETGAIQPIEPLRDLAAKYRLLLHSDATQAIGKVPFHFDSLQLDAMTFASHKFHGPHGIGGLLIRGGITLNPLFFGGSQQLESRPGTEPVMLAVAMAEALRISCERLEESRVQIEFLRNRFEQRLHASIAGIEIHCEKTPRLANTSCISFPAADRQMLLLRLDRKGLACSTGSACSSGSSEPSHVLRAMGCPQDSINSALRFSLSRFSTLAEIDQAVDLIVNCYNKLK